jgi:phosphoribosylamine-glycine ligase
MLQTNIIITEEGPKVLGYKASFGETEAQALLPLLSWDCYLEEIMIACVESRLIEPRENSLEIGVEKDRKSAVVVLAAPGFPQNFLINLPIYINRGNQSTGKYIIHFPLQLATSKVNMVADLEVDHLPGEHYNFYLDAVSTSEPSQMPPTMRSTGGRIMAVSAQAKTIEEALERAEGIARQIEFGDDVNHNRPYYRTDIGT